MGTYPSVLSIALKKALNTHRRSACHSRLLSGQMTSIHGPCVRRSTGAIRARTEGVRLKGPRALCKDFRALIAFDHIQLPYGTCGHDA